MAPEEIAKLRQGLSPLITVSSAKDAIAFYCEAFGAQEIYRLTDPADGRIGHAELIINGALIMLADEYPEAEALSPHAFGGSPVRMNVVLSNVEEALEKAVGAGAEIVMALTTQFYGDKSATVRDPYGYLWMLSETVEIVDPEEMQQRWNAMVSG